ncbi:MAG TPA: NAD(P)-binding domain-containing protein [Vicinamibacterales bacterium]|nr:NAD(P)-binding domain-containing protein [Vicinamibacterales bacterium]
MTNTLPVAVIGAGPVGLAAAAHLHTYRQPFIVLEAGAAPGAAIRKWGHVRTFSPWRYMIDNAARDLLTANGWQAPDADAIPNGDELVDRFVVPLAQHPAIAPHVRFNARVMSVGRKDFDKVRTKGRDQQPFEIRLANGEVIEARAVIDASGTWEAPNPAGSGGVPVPGEREHAGRIAYGIPDVMKRERSTYAGKRVLVVGSGHSAFNVILDLMQLADEAPGTDVVWVMRKENLDTVWGGGASDALEARGELGQRAKRAVEAGRLQVLTPFRIRAIEGSSNGLVVRGVMRDEPRQIEVDRIVVCAGFRPDLDMHKEVRLSIDPWLECTAALGPLIDPNEHSCGTVRPHGARELAHAEKDFYVIGMKSYGRAPTFLLATGYEQARSVVAMLSGDVAAAERVELVLPETGVCNTTLSATGAGCCGGPAPAEVDACCVADADAKAAGESGCGCGTPAPVLLQIGSRAS